MSSSFLYLAIVGVWAFVLVPRWLRRQYSRVQPTVDEQAGVDVEYAEEYDVEAYYYDENAADSQSSGDARATQEVTYAAATSARARRDGRPVRPAPARTPLSRSRMLRSRRRLLMMHLMLVAVAVACVALKITSWLVIIPPVAMLGMYLLLLREVAVADAEQAHRRAVLEAQAHDAWQSAYEAAPEPEPEPVAEIIDISDRVGDQLYDQYADAAVRAVGD